MLAIKDVPAEIEERYNEYKALAKDVFASCRSMATTERLPKNTDLFKHTCFNAVVYVVEGYFKLSQRNKHLRLYSDSDFVVSDETSKGFSLTSDFGSDIAVFDRKAFTGRLKDDATLLGRWTRLQQYENSINLALYAFHLQSDIYADFAFNNYEPGETITQEGETPAGIYEMVSGSATVIHDNKEVGFIGAGEIFGEISFLTGRSRTATVKADKRCIIRVVNKEDFFKLIQTNPNLIISISKTLARRIVQLNDKLVEVWI